MTRLISLLVLVFTSLATGAQALPTATRDLGFSVFATGSRVATDYDSENHGLTLGADAVRHFHRFHLFDPGLEVRFGLSSGPLVSERTVFVGPRLERRLGRAHLYGDFLFGRGTLGFEGSSTSGGAFSYGGGVDFDLTRHLALKLDYSQESWKLPTETNRLTPGKASVGLVWHFGGGGGPR